MRDANFKIPDIDKLEEIKEKLREKIQKLFRSDDATMEKLLKLCDWYADKKIDFVFEQENTKERYNRPCANCGKINRTRSSVCEKCCPSKI